MIVVTTIKRTMHSDLKRSMASSWYSLEVPIRLTKLGEADSARLAA